MIGQKPRSTAKSLDDVDLVELLRNPTAAALAAIEEILGGLPEPGTLNAFLRSEARLKDGRSEKLEQAPSAADKWPSPGYRKPPSRVEGRQLVLQIEELHRGQEWWKLMELLGLEMPKNSRFLEYIQPVLDAGRWRGKSDPVKFILDNAKKNYYLCLPVLGAPHNPLPMERWAGKKPPKHEDEVSLKFDRTLVYVDKAIDRTQRLELTSWKKIANYLGVSVDIAQKLERERGLPVDRAPGPRGRVSAVTRRLEAWKLQFTPDAAAPTAKLGCAESDAELDSEILDFLTSRKVECIVPDLMRTADDLTWNLIPKLRSAIGLIAGYDSTEWDSFDQYCQQQGLPSKATSDSQVVALAKCLSRFTTTEITEAFGQYALAKSQSHPSVQSSSPARSPAAVSTTSERAFREAFVVGPSSHIFRAFKSNRPDLLNAEFAEFNPTRAMNRDLLFDKRLHKCPRQYAGNVSSLRPPSFVSSQPAGSAEAAIAFKSRRRSPNCSAL